MRAHTCHALACRSSCPPRHLMCSPCWKLVPAGLQRLVYGTFNPAQCRPGASRPGPTGAWMVAADAAIVANALLREPPTEATHARVLRIAVHKLRLAAVYAQRMDEDAVMLLRAARTATPTELEVLREALEQVVRLAEQGALL